jgi:cell wall-associated NlpC family hydrolase
MGMYIGGGKMVHAPHTGDVVKISPIDGRPWAGAVRVA